MSNVFKKHCELTSPEEGQRYEIWSEGYAATGDSGTACYHGTSVGTNFRDACRNLARSNLKFRSSYDSRTNSCWGCKLFDNEDDARRSYG